MFLKGANCTVLLLKSNLFQNRHTETHFQAISRQHLNFEIQILLERDYQNDSIKIKGYSVTHFEF